MGGPDIPGIGFAAGIERIMTIMNELETYIPQEKLDIFIMNLEDSGYAFQVLDDLRSSGYSCEIDYTGKSMKGMWKLVDKYNPSYVLIIGEDEVKGNYITVKDNTTKESIQVKSDELMEYLDMNF